MSDNQTLSALTGALFEKFEQLLTQHYDLLLVQGDTTTALVAAQVAFYHRIPVGHIEAGLRTHDIQHPFPEEMNRVFISKIASFHFVPTTQEEATLKAESVPGERIYVTGNTVIDSLLHFASQSVKTPEPIDAHKKTILVTLHRRENFGAPLESVFRAFLKLTESFPDIEIIYPVHPNPNVRLVAEKLFSHQSNIRLIKSVSYDAFVALMNQSYLILSDSGGIQEEAPALNKPLLILREVTERPLVVSMGMAKLVGTDTDTIVNEVSNLLTNHTAYQHMQRNASPYGDGKASKRAVC